MKSISKKSAYLVFVSLLFVLIGTSSFKPVENTKPAGIKCANCDFQFVWSSFSTIAYGEVADPFSSVSSTSFTYWPGNFSYQSGSVTFTVQFPKIHPAGTLTLYRGSTQIDSRTVFANTSTIHQLVETSPNCAVDYVLTFTP
jgi:hypothetical protein